MNWKSIDNVLQSKNMKKKLKNYSYDENGNLRGKMQIDPPTPTRIQWSFNEDLLKTIDDAYNDALKLAAVSKNFV